VYTGAACGGAGAAETLTASTASSGTQRVDFDTALNPVRMMIT
jgi:hypothetical protein